MITLFLLTHCISHKNKPMEQDSNYFTISSPVWRVVMGTELDWKTLSKIFCEFGQVFWWWEGAGCSHWGEEEWASWWSGRRLQQSRVLPPNACCIWKSHQLPWQTGKENTLHEQMVVIISFMFSSLACTYLFQKVRDFSYLFCCRWNSSRRPQLDCMPSM